MIDQPAPDDPTVRCSIDGPLATVTLLRPDRLNAQTPQLWAELARIGAELPSSVRVVVLRGDGRAFSAGLDRARLGPDAPNGGMTAVADGSDQEVADRIAIFQDAFTWLTDGDFVSVAAVQGHAIGAGFQLALACDLRVLADDAQLCMAETSLGLVPDLTGTTTLIRAVGYSRALEICATGRWVGAAEAGQLGIATAVVPVDELDAAVRDLVSALLAAPEPSLRATKRLLRDAAERTRVEQNALERTTQVPLLQAVAGRG